MKILDFLDNFVSLGGFGAWCQVVLAVSPCPLECQPMLSNIDFNVVCQKCPQYSWELHDQLWEALSGTTSKKRGVPGRTGGERILEMLWKPQMPRIIGLGRSQPYSRGEFQETLWERFRGLSGIFPEYLPESASRTGGMADCGGHLQTIVVISELQNKLRELGSCIWIIS